VARSDSPAGLTPAGWSALRTHGIRTIVDLHNDDERTTHTAAAGLDTVHVPPADIADDYELSNPRLKPLRRRSGASHHHPRPYGQQDAPASPVDPGDGRAVVGATLEAVAVEAVLRGAGLSGRQAGAVRRRLLGLPGR